MFFGGALCSVTRAKISPKPKDADERVWAISKSEVVTDTEGDKSLVHAEIKVFLLDENYFATSMERILRK
jgi:hypothetical protein